MERIARRNEFAAAAASRIGLALLISAALHLLLISRVEMGGPRRQEPAATIHARLNIEPSEAARPAAPIRAPVWFSPSVTSIPVAVPPPVLEQPEAVEQTEPDIAAHAPAEAGGQPQLIAVPVDPVYYAARELDVYPAPLEPLRSPPGATATAPGWVRVLALVDETGAVTQAEIFDSDPQAVFDEAALRAVRAARFSPARKEGHAVRSRILIELSFEDKEQQ